MKDNEKTKEQLVKELTELRSQDAVLEKARKELAVIKIAADELGAFAESIINTVREPLIALDQDLRVVKVSSSFYDFFKVNPEETVGQLIYDLGNKQWDIPKLRELLETILPEKATFENYEVEHDFATIGRRTMLLNARQIQRVLGKEKIILLAIEDITEHKQLEDLLTESEERYRRLFETASDGIVLLEKREGKITHANPAAEKMLGYSLEESVGKKLQDIGIFDIDDFPTIMQILNKIGILNYNDVPVKTKSGKHIDTDIYLVDRARLAQCNIRDITNRKQAEETLRKNEKKYRELYDFLPIPVYEMDFEANIISANRAIYETFRGTEEDLKKGFKGWQLLSPEEVDKSAKNILRLLAGEQIGGTEYTLMRLDGSVFPAIVISSVIYSDDKPVGLRGAIVDITERKQAEKALKENEKKYRLLADNVNDVIFVLDMNLNYTYISPSVKILRGYEPEEVMKHLVNETLTPSSWDLAVKTLSEVMELEKSGHREISESRTLQLEMMRKDGTTVWTEVKFSFIRDEDQRPMGIMGVTRDITERKRTEEELQRTLERLKKAINATIQVMVSAIEVRDPYTSGHQIRSTNLARTIATEMGLPPNIIDGIRMAGSIHDIGKLSIPSEILSKPTKLTNIEFSLIKEHSLKGYEMLKDVESPWPLAEIVYQHHERMDGSGYPRNLKGDDILMEARILAVADVVEAMASHRPYRAGLGIDAALNEIEKNRGIFYDITVADACLRLFREKGFKLEGHDFKQ
jgi:PAS domain S-box-containing protein